MKTSYGASNFLLRSRTFLWGLELSSAMGLTTFLWGLELSYGANNFLLVLRSFLWSNFLLGFSIFLCGLEFSFRSNNFLLAFRRFLCGLKLSRCCPRGFLLERLHLPGQEIHQTLSDADQPEYNGNSNQPVMATNL